jgi:acetyltransferase-like isoleucine patch superfamily enzyme
VRLFILNFLLARARYEPPWAAMFSAVLANTFPLRFFFRRLFGPQSRSVTVGDIVCFLDPHMVEIGRNVHLGYHALVIGHVVDNRGLLIGKVRIGDDVVIGGGSLVMPGVRIGNHAVVGARSMVRPDTVIGPYEYWAGAPARKIKDLSPEEDAQTTA